MEYRRGELSVTWNGVSAKDFDCHDHYALNKEESIKTSTLNTLIAAYKDCHGCYSLSQHTHLHYDSVILDTRLSLIHKWLVH